MQEPHSHDLYTKARRINSARSARGASDKDANARPKARTMCKLFGAIEVSSAGTGRSTTALWIPYWAALCNRFKCSIVSGLLTRVSTSNERIRPSP